MYATGETVAQAVGDSDAVVNAVGLYVEQGEAVSRRCMCGGAQEGEQAAIAAERPLTRQIRRAAIARPRSPPVQVPRGPPAWVLTRPLFFLPFQDVTGVQASCDAVSAGTSAVWSDLPDVPDRTSSRASSPSSPMIGLQPISVDLVQADPPSADPLRS